MAGKRQKPPDELVYRRGGRAKPLVPVAPAQLAPPLPDELGDYAAAVWAAFWASKVSGAVDLDADGEALRHWIRCVDEREKLRAATVRAPLVKGSHEQLMLNPLFRRLRELNREIGNGKPRRETRKTATASDRIRSLASGTPGYHQDKRLIEMISEASEALRETLEWLRERAQELCEESTRLVERAKKNRLRNPPGD